MNTPFGAPWSKECDEYVIEHYLRQSDAKLAINLHKLFGVVYTKKAVQTRRRRLGCLRVVTSDKGVYRFGARKTMYIKVNGKRLPVVLRRMYLPKGQAEVVVAALLVKPFYMAAGDTARNSVEMIRRKYTNWKTNRMGSLTWEKVRKIREQWNRDQDLTIPELGRRHNIKKSIILHVIYNTIFHDPEYTPKPRREPKYIEIFGETKTLAEWSRDPRCEISWQLCYLRYAKGVRGEDLLKKNTNAKSLAIFGETKSLVEWSRDSRCEVHYSTLKKRYRNGMRGEQILRSV